VHGFDFSHNDVHLSYLPLAHMLERVVQACLWCWGVKVGFFRGEITKLNEDIQTLKPTIFASVPRLFNRIYDAVISTVEKTGGMKKTLFDRAYESKKQNLSEGAMKHILWDKLVFGKVSERLGGRTRVMISGSAPISPDVLAFLRISFSCPVVEGYGQTETGAAICISDPADTTVGHVGLPVPCNELKLVDVPEMNYLATNTPYPQGEICARGPNIFVGYFKNQEKTDEVLEKNGWLHTGDIGQLDEKGRLKIIDRKKNIFKLAQGEYLAPEKLELIFIRAPLIQQAFVYGDSFQSQLVAIIIPDAEVVKHWAKENSMETTDLRDLCKNPKLKQDIMKVMGEYGKEAKLRGFEFVKNIHLHPEPFSVENELLTPTFKLKRPVAKKIFQEQLDELYKELAQQEKKD